MSAPVSHVESSARVVVGRYAVPNHVGEQRVGAKLLPLVLLGITQLAKARGNLKLPCCAVPFRCGLVTKVSGGETPYLSTGLEVALKWLAQTLNLDLNVDLT